MVKLKLQYFGHLMQRTDSLQKNPDAGKDWRQEEKWMTEDEMVEWHWSLDGHEFAQAPGVGDGQGSLVCCSSFGSKELDTLESLNSWVIVLISCLFSLLTTHSTLSSCQLSTCALNLLSPSSSLLMLPSKEVSPDVFLDELLVISTWYKLSSSDLSPTAWGFHCLSSVWESLCPTSPFFLLLGLLHHFGEVWSSVHSRGGRYRT